MVNTMRCIAVYCNVLQCIIVKPVSLMTALCQEANLQVKEEKLKEGSHVDVCN